MLAPLSLLILPTTSIASAAPAVSPKLTLSTHCFTLGHKPAIVVVNLAGVGAHQKISFTIEPHSPRGFGGGIMGVRTANNHGVIHFTYPVPNTSNKATGIWVITAYSRTHVVRGHPVYGKLLTYATFTIRKSKCR